MVTLPRQGPRQSLIAKVSTRESLSFCGFAWCAVLKRELEDLQEGRVENQDLTGPLQTYNLRAELLPHKLFERPQWGSPKASHIKASHPHFPRFPRFRVRIFRIFRVFRVFVLRNLLRPLFSWAARDVRIFRIFPVSDSNRWFRKSDRPALGWPALGDWDPGCPGHLGKPTGISPRKDSFPWASREGSNLFHPLSLPSWGRPPPPTRQSLGPKKLVFVLFSLAWQFQSMFNVRVTRHGPRSAEIL